MNGQIYQCIDAAGASTNRKQSIGWSASDDFDSMMQRRSSSIGFNRSGSLGLGIDDPSRRPFVGGGSAAAYEAARADHYSSMGDPKIGGADRSRSIGMGGGGMAVNPNQHYEMLKLHHMNLLNEIQETTLMMNLYQQQQLQQQQEQLQREGDFSVSGTAGGFGRQSIGRGDSLGSGSSSQRPSIGMMSVGGVGVGGATQGTSDDLVSAQEQQLELEERLRLIKEDIAARQKEADELQAAAAKKEEANKRKAENVEEGSEDVDTKRTKTDKDGMTEAKGTGDEVKKEKGGK